MGSTPDAIGHASSSAPIVARGLRKRFGKTRIGGDRLEVVVRDPDELAAATAAVGRATGNQPQVEAAARRISVPVRGGSAALVAAVRELDQTGIVTEDLALRRPTLDDVFLRVTGTTTTREDEAA
jgi:ABC-2 type transport system ATP-binding protein